MKLLISAFCAVSLLASGANQVINSSFEMGLEGHGVMSYVAYKNDSLQPEVVLDDTTAVHGKRSLRIDNRKANAFVEYTSAEVFFEPGSTVSYSVWLKADRPVEVLLYLLDHDPDISRPELQSSGPNGGWTAAGAYHTVTTEWKRYTLTKKILKPTRKYTLQIELQRPVMLWIDAVQFETGNVTPYTPAAPVEAAFSMDDHVLINGKNSAEIAVVNYTDKARKAELKTNVGCFEFNLPPNSFIRRKIKFNADRFGTFSLGGILKSDDFSGKVYPVDYGVVGKVPKTKKNGFFLGVNAGDKGMGLTFILRPVHRLSGNFVWRSNTKETIERNFRNLRLAGYSFVRLHDTRFSWLELEPQKGKFNWDILDTIVENSEKYGIDIMFVLGNDAIVYDINNSRGQGWFVRKNSKPKGIVMGDNWQSMLPDEKDWADFTRALVSRYKGRIRYYEVMNEPNLVMPDPQDYMRYLKLSYEIIRAEDPAAKVIGICATGDFNGRTEEFIDQIGALGGFRYFDILSFHPYDAPLDTAPNRAERQIERIHKLVAKYRPGTPVLEDEIYYLTDLQKIYNGQLCGRGWPARNLARRYAIDLAGGLVGSVPITGQQLEAGDAGHRNTWSPARFSLHYVPREHFIASNAFARFLENGTFLAKPDISSLLNSFVFHDRNGREAAMIWALTSDGECVFDLPSGVEAFDLFGNPVKEKTIDLTEDPVYLFGLNLKQKIESVNFRMKAPYRVTGAAETIHNGAKSIVVEFRNMTSVPRKMQVRIAGIPETQKFTVAPDSVKAVYFPLNGKERKEIELIVVDDGRLFREKIPVTAHKTTHSGKAEKIGDFAEFTPTLLPEGFLFDIRVTDSSLTPRMPEQPWKEDCVEFFFDANPDTNLNRSAYTEKGMLRLFLVPPSSDGKSAALVDMKMRPVNVKWSLKRGNTGYTASVLIPWQLLGATPDAPPAFDLIVSDFSVKKKLKSSVWAGNKDNFRNRLNFGRIGK